MRRGSVSWRIATTEQSQLLSHAAGEEPQHADAAYRQRAWLPWWAIPLLAAVIALLLLLLI